jgi:GNAT superfamily N-acetyltransferase
MHGADVAPSELSRLAPLFEDRVTLRAVVASVLEGRLGRAVADCATAPRVARLALGCYAIFGGDPHHPAAAGLVRSVEPPVELLYPDRGDWRELLRREHPGRVSDRPMRAYLGDRAELERLAALAASVPEPYRIERLDVALAGQLGPRLAPHAVQVFEHPESFVARGIGFGATHGGRLVCASTSYACSAADVEQSIATDPDHRRRGLARAVAARFMQHCLERDLIPHWNASNPVSQRLALTLGFRPIGTCDVLYLDV